MSNTYHNRSHIDRQPRGFVLVRVLQLFFAIVLLAFSIFQDVVLPTVGSVLGTCAAGVALIVLVWLLISNYGSPKGYNYWAVLAFEIFLFLFWIPTFVFMVGNALSTTDYTDDYCYRRYNYTTHTSSYVCTAPDTLSKVFGASLALTAALSGALLILYLVSLIVVSVSIGRHRATGGHCRPGSVAPVGPDEVRKRFEAEEGLRQQNLHLQQENAALQEKLARVAQPQPVHYG